MDAPSDWARIVEELGQTNLRRKLRTVRGTSGRTVQLDGSGVLNFSSNNYMGFAAHPDLAEAAEKAMRTAGFGTGASRLIVGNHEQHEHLESELAAFHGCEAVLLFNSGYQANVGTIQALADDGDVVFSDALNHASIIDGCRLSRAKVIVYPHADVEALRRELANHGQARRKLVVSDSVFSMDGDRAPLRKLAQLCDEFGAVLMLDEAHATGVLGPGGRGAAAEVGIRPQVHVGTLGKGFGSFGAYVAGSEHLIQLLLNKARSFVFTTALPVGVVAATRAALSLIRSPEGEKRRRRLSERIGRFRRGMESLGMLAPGAGTSPVFPVVVGDEQRTMDCCEYLLERGIYAQGIRPPTVPRGTSRLRFALMATHLDRDIDFVLAELGKMVSGGLLVAAIGGCQSEQAAAHRFGQETPR
ncbi:MAG: 8-amino-7-oxononanoate synthase [Proteobacteria bacterium]|nr:8-amino-7-oxononanoate synthase [Pseudomonadota bacterium]